LEDEVWAGFPDLTELLLEKGARVDDKDNKGDTALMVAQRTQKTEVVKVLQAHGAQ
jgi:ankyrin repeat protein